MRRKSDIVLIILFVLMLAAPYLFAHRQPQERASDMENRMLAGYPSLITEDEKLNSSYKTQYEDWLNDNLRGRVAMMEVNATLQYRLFHRIAKTDTLAGKNGWLFVKDKKQIQEYQRINLLSEQELKQYAERIQLLSDYLKDRGVSFYYFPAYNKETIYPEEYTDDVLQLSGISRTEQMIRALQEQTDVNLVVCKEKLEEKKQEELLYFQYYDLLHWNETGVFIGYQELMGAIQKDYPKVKVLSRDDFTVEIRPEAVKLYGLDYPYRENVPLFIPNKSNARDVTDQKTEQWNYLYNKGYTTCYENKASGNDLKIMLFSDSFIVMDMKEDIAESFSETMTADWQNLTKLEQILEEYEPNVVVFEYAELLSDTAIRMVNELDYLDACS